MSQKDFHFIGKAPLSKSLLNRALIIKSWYPDFVIHGSSSCGDVLIMESAVKKISQFALSFKIGYGDSRFRGNDSVSGNDKASGNDSVSGNDNASGNDSASGNDNASGNDSASGNDKASGNDNASGNDSASGNDKASGNDNASGNDSASGNDFLSREGEMRENFVSIEGKDSEDKNKKLTQNKEFDCALSGTAFRFLAVRLSREKGEFVLTADKALFKRPLEEAVSLLSQLSVSIKKTEQAYVIFSEGWGLQGDCVYVPSQITSQWASALLLNSWNLDQDLYFVFNSSAVSYPYFKMTLDFVRKLGLIVHQKGSDFFIPKGQYLKKREYHPEQDKSCLFTLACFAVLKGKAVFLDWEEESLQADHIFPNILKTMGVSVDLREDHLIVSKCEDLKALDVSVKREPDLFPMLSVLCAKVEGLSILREVSHLDFKESSRAQKLKELLEKCGIKVEIQNDDFLIYGQKSWNHKITPFLFDTEEDHRLVMAGELVSVMGVPITLKGKSAVNKSFPEFYSLIQSCFYTDPG